MTDSRRGTGAEARSLKRMPRFREIVLDVISEGKRAPTVHAIAQMEVTGIRHRMAAMRRNRILPPSMTAYVVYCVARAVAANPGVHALRKGRDLVLFDEVDISTAVERRLPDGSTVPASLVIRGADRLTLREIHQRIRAAQKVEMTGMSVGGDAGARKASFLAALPWLLRRPVWWRMRRDPLFRKRNLGTVNVTAVGMFAEIGATGWGLPVGSWPLTVTVGTLSRVFIPDDAGQPRLAEMLNTTITVDHRSIDGAPTARFAVQLRDLLRSGAGLDDYEATAGATGAGAV